MAFSDKDKRVSYVLKCIVIIFAIAGIILSAHAGRKSFMGGNRVFMYFTIQSNLVIAFFCLYGAILLKTGRHIKNSWYVIKFVGTVSITLTGVVFCFILAPVLGKHAWNLQNVFTHVIVPIVAVIDFFVTGIYGSIKWQNVFFVALPPLLYAIYAGIGYAAGWEFAPGTRYPYFFLNWGSPAGAFGFTKGIPYMGCVWWILLLCVFLFAVGFLYLFMLNVLKRLRHKTRM